VTARTSTIALLTLIFAGCASTPTPQSPPNILFLFADDLRRDTVGAFGGENVHTPHLDQLAARGTALDGVYCMGSRHGAVCVPSRAMVMSGRVLTRAPDNLQGCVTLPELLRERGYRTFLTGKWHNGNESLRRAFPDARAVLRGGMANHYEIKLCDVTEGEVHDVRIGAGHSTDLFADATIDFLQRQAEEAGDQPFFAYVSFTAPHDPRDPPPEWLRRLQHLPPPELPLNFRSQHGLDLGKPTMTVRDENLMGWPRDPDQLRDQLVEYRALVAHLDAQIGRILTALETNGFGKNTLIVFAADHGLALGSHGLLGKQSLYEHSMASPVVLAGPGIPAGSRRAGLAYLLDLMPTMAIAGGVTLPDDIDGEDLTPLVRGESNGRRTLLTAYAKTQRAIRLGDYKLIRLPGIDRTLMFDVVRDPDELFDLAKDADHQLLREELEQRLRREQELVGDDLGWTADEVGPATVDLSGKRFKPDRWQPEWIVEKYWPQEFWRQSKSR